MKKNIIIGLAILAALVAGNLIYSNLNDTSDQNLSNSEDQSKVTDANTQDPDFENEAEVLKADSSDDSDSSDTNTTAAGSYVVYSDAAFASSTTSDNLLFFHASWCPQCLKLEADINASRVPADVTIFEVDFDSNQDLRAKYGVTQQTTVVKVDSDGNLIAKFNAYSDPTLDAVSAALL